MKKISINEFEDYINQNIFDYEDYLKDILPELVHEEDILLAVSLDAKTNSETVILENREFAIQFPNLDKSIQYQYMDLTQPDNRSIIIKRNKQITKEGHIGLLRPQMDFQKDDLELSKNKTYRVFILPRIPENPQSEIMICDEDQYWIMETHTFESIIDLLGPAVYISTRQEVDYATN